MEKLLTLSMPFAGGKGANMGEPKLKATLAWAFSLKKLIHFLFLTFTSFCGLSAIQSALPFFSLKLN